MFVLFLKEAIANLPLILLVSAALSTQISRKLSGKVGRKVMKRKKTIFR